ncbi:MAG TPA: hypothetical protein VKY37_11380 [Brumimicrobium sp.]|nr:hypothetical protein [Brumimicrobium sp.]
MRNLLNYIGLALLAVTFAFTGIEKKRIVIDVSHGGQDRKVQKISPRYFSEF